MSYYYRVGEDDIYGPVDGSTLLQWAEDGDLDPRLEIAEDPEGPWFASASISNLGMDWLVEEDEDTPAMGPMHILALAKHLEEETIAPDSQITQVSSGETFEAVDVLCALLLEQRTDLQEKLDRALAAQPETTESPASPSSQTEAALMAAQKEIESLHQQLANLKDNADLPEDLPDKREWRDVMRTKDELGKEAEKWKKFFEDESLRSKKKEAVLNDQITTLKDCEQEAIHRIAQLEKKRRTLEEQNFELKEAIAQGTAPDADETDSLKVLNLKRSYNELHDKLELVLGQLKDRTEQLEELYTQRDAIEIEARHKQDELQDSVQQERGENQKIRRQLIDLESAHRELLLSYRDLNDRIVRDRNTTSGMSQSRPQDKTKRRRKKSDKNKQGSTQPDATAEGSSTQSSTEAMKSDTKPENKPPRGGRGGKKRLKLT